ncbi:MAG: hypothetical protein JNL42_01200 [Anaerolineae bacterium]|nr:hypothetical protein [Anaerolineae bacterium]
MFNRQVLKLVMPLIVALFLVSAAAAQDATPAVPFSDSPTSAVITQLPSDARAGTCSAYRLPNFAPYVVRQGDTLPLLLAGSKALTVTQAAALNCLDDPSALPVGAVIFLPAPADDTVSATLDSGEPAALLAFAAEPAEARSGDAVTFSWVGTGDAAYFFPCPPDRDAECLRPANAPALPVEGGAVVNGFAYAGVYRYGVEIVGAGDPARQTVQITVTCAQEWLGGRGALPLCPEEPPHAVFAAWQPFERGAMIWFSDTAQIYVFSEDGVFRIYSDTFVEGMPESTLTPPAGLIAPVRGFRRVWDAVGGETALGWATAPEQGFDSARQPAGRVSYTSYLLMQGGVVFAITELPDAEQGYWSAVPAIQE